MHGPVSTSTITHCSASKQTPPRNPAWYPQTRTCGLNRRASLPFACAVRLNSKVPDNFSALHSRIPDRKPVVKAYFTPTLYPHHLPRTSAHQHVQLFGPGYRDFPCLPNFLKIKNKLHPANNTFISVYNRAFAAVTFVDFTARFTHDKRYLQWYASHFRLLL